MKPMRRRAEKVVFKGLYQRPSRTVQRLGNVKRRHYITRYESLRQPGVRHETIFSSRINFAMISAGMDSKASSNKLHAFFLNVVRQSFWQLGINDATVMSYVADVLSDFARSDNLFQVRRAGKKLDSLVEIAAQKQNESVDESSLLRERSLRKYVGDYALYERDFSQLR